MAKDDPRRREVAEFVRRRRSRLKISVSEAARRAGVDRGTWMGLEDGTRATQDRHWAGIEHALQIGEGSIERLFAGLSAILLEEAEDKGAAEKIKDEKDVADIGPPSAAVLALQAAYELIGDPVVFEAMAAEVARQRKRRQQPPDTPRTEPGAAS